MTWKNVSDFFSSWKKIAETRSFISVFWSGNKEKGMQKCAGDGMVFEKFDLFYIDAMSITLIEINSIFWKVHISRASSRDQLESFQMILHWKVCRDISFYNQNGVLKDIIISHNIYIIFKNIISFHDSYWSY